MNSNWKSAVAGTALALTVHAGIAGKPLPCPTSSPLVDTAHVVKEGIRQKIENRLRKVDLEKRHQVVVVTIDRLDEYGYGSIEEMANAIGKGCKVGYRWEDSGVVVLHTEIPSLYRIETAKTQRYITDLESSRILTNSKSEGICRKEDASCRLDDITFQIERLIRREYPDLVGLAPSPVPNSEVVSAQRTSDLLNSLGFWAIVVLVLGSAGIGGHYGIEVLRKNSRRRSLKKAIFELYAHLLTEMQKYPDWFLDQYAADHDAAVRGMSAYSDDAVDGIVDDPSQEAITRGLMDSIRDSVATWPREFARIDEKLHLAKFDLKDLTIRGLQLQQELEWQGYRLWNIVFPAVTDGGNYMDTLTRIATAKKLANEAIVQMEESRKFYMAIVNLADGIESDFIKKKAEYEVRIVEYREIFGTVPRISWSDLEEQVPTFAKAFRNAYRDKDVPELRILFLTGKSLSRMLSDATNMMVDEINWFHAIPSEVALKRKKIVEIRPGSDFQSVALAYMKKTGNRNFSDYDISESSERLNETLDTISELHAQKIDIESIRERFQIFDSEFARMKEYSELGSELAILIVEEGLMEHRKKRDEIRRKQEEDDRKLRQEEEARFALANITSIASTSHSTDWNSGGGGGYGGGGATSD